MDRRIKLDTIGNCRQLGGLTTEDGRRVREGTLLRAAMLGRASDEDLAALRDVYRLDTVIDLRTLTESGEKPDRLIEGIELLHVPVLDEAAAGITHERTKTPRELRPILPYDMAAMYRRIVAADSARANMKHVLETIFTHDYDHGAVLWHCSEGKDRAGIVAALTLGALGVGILDIIDDYLMTNEVNGPKAQHYYDRVLAVGRTQREAEIIRDIYIAHESYLDAALAVVLGTYGGFEGYLTDGLGIDAALIENFRKNVLEESNHS